MNINTKNIVSITEANQNFSKVARLVDENGAAIILKNNVPPVPCPGIQPGGARGEDRRRKPAGYLPAPDCQEPQGL